MKNIFYTALLLICLSGCAARREARKKYFQIYVAEIADCAGALIAPDECRTRLGCTPKMSEERCGRQIEAFYRSRDVYVGQCMEKGKSSEVCEREFYN